MSIPALSGCTLARWSHLRSFRQILGWSRTVSGRMLFDERPVARYPGRFRLRALANVVCTPCAVGLLPRFKREVGFGKEDQDLVSASATAKHASCCRCAKRRPGIRDRGRPLPNSRPLVHSLCDHTTRSRLADGEGGKIPCVGFYGGPICGTSRLDRVAMWNWIATHRTAKRPSPKSS